MGVENKTVVVFGHGNVLMVPTKENEKACLKFAQSEREFPLGTQEWLPLKKYESLSFPIVLQFDNTESINNLIFMLERVKKLVD
jgi:hypothetical protein